MHQFVHTDAGRLHASQQHLSSQPQGDDHGKAEEVYPSGHSCGSSSHGQQHHTECQQLARSHDSN